MLTRGAEWMRRGRSTLVLAAVFAAVYGLDTGVLTRLSTAGTNVLAQKPVDTAHDAPAVESAMTSDGPGTMKSSAMARKGQAPKTQTQLQFEGFMPPLTGVTTWLNSQDLAAEDLKGKVVLIDFWNYSCISCLRAVPYVRAWAEKYKDKGLVVIGVHVPTFAFEKKLANVHRAVTDLGIPYPVAVDSTLSVWRAFNTADTPARYFIDANGIIRHHQVGEGAHDESERVIQKLLAEAGATNVPANVVAVGAEALSAANQVESPETYVGYERAENFVSPGGAVHNASHVYSVGEPRLNEWGLGGAWTVGPEHATSTAEGGRIVFRFRARDLHLVLGTSSIMAVRFRITLDGKPPGEARGAGIDANGFGIITRPKLYHLVRQKGAISDRTFAIEFLDPGAEAFAITVS